MSNIYDASGANGMPQLFPWSQRALGPGMPTGGAYFTPPSSQWGMPSPVQIMPGGTGGANAGNANMPMGSAVRGRSMGGGTAAGAAFAMPPVASGPVQPAASAAVARGASATGLGVRAAASLSNLGGSTAGRVAGRAGGLISRHPYATALFGPTADQLVTGWTGSETAGNAAGMALSGAALGGGVGGPWGALAGGLLGGGAGLLGVNPSDIPVVGNVWDFLGGGNAPAGAEGVGEPPTAEEMEGTFGRVLNGLGADDEYVNRAWAQYQLSLELNPDLDEAGQAALGQQVLQSAMTQLGLDQERQYHESNIAAVQAWMEPMMREQLDRSQFYADNYAALGTAAAQDISNPGLRSALEAQGAAYSAQQASANSLALQQMAFYPEAFLGEVADAYDGQLAALQAQIDMGTMGGGFVQAPMPSSITGIGSMGGANAPVLSQATDGSYVGAFPPTVGTWPEPPPVQGQNVPPTQTSVPQMGPIAPPAPTGGLVGPPAPDTQYDAGGNPTVDGQPVSAGTTLPYPVFSNITGSTIPPGTPLPQGLGNLTTSPAGIMNVGTRIRSTDGSNVIDLRSDQGQERHRSYLMAANTR